MLFRSKHPTRTAFDVQMKKFCNCNYNLKNLFIVFVLFKSLRGIPYYFYVSWPRDLIEYQSTKLFTVPLWVKVQLLKVDQCPSARLSFLDDDLCNIPSSINRGRITLSLLLYFQLTSYSITQRTLTSRGRCRIFEVLSRSEEIWSVHDGFKVVGEGTE